MKKNTRTKQANRKRLAAAIMELLVNPETPEDLQDKLSDFLCESSNGSIVGRYTQVPGGLQALEHLLAFAEWEKANEDWPEDIEVGLLVSGKEGSHAAN